MKRYCRLQHWFGVSTVAFFCTFCFFVLSTRHNLEKKWPRRVDVLRDLAEDEDVAQLKSSTSASKKVNASLYEPYLYIAIKSGPARRERRDVLRKMWVSDCRSGQASRSAGKKKPFVTCDFIVGKANDEALQKGVLDEKGEHGDMILAPLTEGYGRMTAKSLWILFMFFTQRKHHFLMVAEDDIFVMFSTLLPWVSTQPKEKLYTGHYHPAPVVFRCGPDATKSDPNCVSREAYAKDLYPRFAGAFAYILSKDSVSAALHTALGRVSYPGLPGNVEAAIIGVLTDENSISLVDNKAFIDYKLEMCPEISSQGNEVMVVGNAPNDIMSKLADNVAHNRPLCQGVREHKWV